jgi:hypothetical protein
MKTVVLSLMLLTGAAMLSAQVGQDLKAAGKDTKDAATTAGHETKKGTTKAYHKTKSGVKKGVHKSATLTEKGADKVAGKSADTGTK